MVKKFDSNAQRLKRHKRVRAHISGTAQRPRLDVFRSAKNIYAQVIDDVAGVTLASAASNEKDFGIYGGNVEAAKKVGALMPNAQKPRASKKWSLTAAAIFTTAAWKLWQKPPAKAD